MRRGMLILATVLLTVTTAWGQDPDVRRIMEDQQRLHQSDSETATLVMVLVDKGGDKKQRVMRSWKKKMADGLSRTLMAFTEPADIAGTALLSWELADGTGKQWLFLPAMGKMQRVSNSARTDSFMGTDFTYEDMAMDDLDQFDLALTGEADVDGQACYVIEVVPATETERRESGYSKRVFHVRKDILFTVKVEFHDPRGRLIKVQTAHDLERVSGDMWMARKSLMDNQRARHKTLMGIVASHKDAAIDDEVFSERFVLEGRHMQ